MFAIFCHWWLQTPDPLIIRPLHKRRQKKSKYWQLKLFPFAMRSQLLCSLPLWKAIRKSLNRSRISLPSKCDLQLFNDNGSSRNNWKRTRNTKNILSSYPFIIFDLLLSIVVPPSNSLTALVTSKVLCVKCYCGSMLGDFVISSGSLLSIKVIVSMHSIYEFSYELVSGSGSGSGSWPVP